MGAMTISMLTTPWLLDRYGYRHTYIGAVTLLMTGSADWEIVAAEPDPDDPDASGIYDVHSASTAQSASGTPYSEW